MKKLLPLLLAIMLPALAPAAWYDGEATTPNSGDVLADTGPLPPYTYGVTAIVFASVTCAFELQLTDSAGTTVLKKQRLVVIVSNSNYAIPFIIHQTTTAYGRFRIIAKQTLLAGTVGVSLSVEP